MTTINFRKKKGLDKLNSTNDILLYIGTNPLLIEMNIGTPIQNILLSLNIDSSFTYIYTEDTKFDEDKPEHFTPFLKNESESFIELNSSYDLPDDFETAYYFNDTINNTYNLTFIEPINVISTTEDYSGQFGLGLITNNKKTSNYLYNLKQYNIKDYFFIDYINETYGNIVVGIEPNDYNKSKYPNKLDKPLRCFNDNQGRLIWGFIALYAITASPLFITPVMLSEPIPIIKIGKTAIEGHLGVLNQNRKNLHRGNYIKVQIRRKSW